VRGRLGRDRWIYNYLYNQCLSPLTLWVRTSHRWGVLDTTLCDQVCPWLATGRLFSPGTLVSSNKTYLHDITEILLKVALNTIPLTFWLQLPHTTIMLFFSSLQFFSPVFFRKLVAHIDFRCQSNMIKRTQSLTIKQVLGRLCKKFLINLYCIS
jgi:hypothetical protein